MTWQQIKKLTGQNVRKQIELRINDKLSNETTEVTEPLNHLSTNHTHHHMSLSLNRKLKI